MSSDEMKAHVEQCVKAIALPIYEGVTSGLATADTCLATLANLEDYPWLVSATARPAMRNYWLDHLLGDEWRVDGNPRLMGQTLLVNCAERLELRLLKERRHRYPGGVPTAGNNEARRKYWQSPLLGFPPLDGQPLREDATRLLLLWDRFLSDNELITTARVVHTTAPGIYGRKVPVDMSFEIQPGGNMFDQLKFHGDPQDDDFFPEIRPDENEGDDVG